MIELTAETARDYLIRQGRLGTADPVTVETLAGGVSNVVLWIAPQPGTPFVLKQSRAQLRTQADWFSRLDRVFREAEAQRALSRLLTPGAVPAVLFEDRENYCYAMEAVQPDHVVWKQQLLAGQVDHSVFRRAGEMLGDIHATTAGQPDLLADANDSVVFDELRVDPFYRRIAAVHPPIQAAVNTLIDEMNRHRVCLVHADFSPKNLLVHPEGISLVDYETVHYGDPAFDLGFFFSHLWLKAVAFPAVRSTMVAGIEIAWNAYRSRLSAAQSAHGLAMEDVSVRAVPHLAACLLARVDGKSPVDYLRQKSQRTLVREFALQRLQARLPDWDQVFTQFSTAVAQLSS